MCWKNGFALTLIILFLFPLGACSKSKEDFSDTYNAETDFDPYFIGGRTAYTSDGNFFCSPKGYLYYLTDSEDAIPVCNQPDCIHEKETDRNKLSQCPAYFPNAYTCCSYQDKIYLVAQDPTTMEDVIWQIDPKNAQRKVLYRMDMGGWPDNMVAHRGYLYFAVCTGNTVGNVTTKFYRLNLNEANPKPDFVFAIPEDEGIYSFCCYGKYLYITTIGINRPQHLWQYNMQEKTVNRIYFDDSSTAVANGGYWQGRLLIVVQNPENSTEKIVYSMKIDGSDVQPFETAEPINTTSYFWAWKDYLLKQDYREDAPVSLKIYDGKQTEIAHITDPDYCWYCATPFGLTCHSGKHGQDMNYLTLAEIASGGNLTPRLVYEGPEGDTW